MERGKRKEKKGEGGREIGGENNSFFDTMKKLACVCVCVLHHHHHGRRLPLHTRGKAI